MSRTGILLGRHLVLTCAVAARDETAVNGDNQPVRGYLTETTGVPCRLGALSAAERETAVQGGIVAYESALLLPLSAPAPARGRVRDIRRKDGSVADPGPWEITEVIERNADAPQFRRLLLRRTGA